MSYKAAKRCGVVAAAQNKGNYNILLVEAFKCVVRSRSLDCISSRKRVYYVGSEKCDCVKISADKGRTEPTADKSKLQIQYKVIFTRISENI